MKNILSNSKNHIGYKIDPTSVFRPRSKSFFQHIFFVALPTVLLVALSTLLLSGCSAPNITFSSARQIERSERVDCPADSSTTCRATVGTAYTGALPPIDDSDWIRVTLSALTIYEIVLTGDQEIILRNETNEELPIDNNRFTTQAGGSYIVVISGGSGEYSLLISRIREFSDTVRVILADDGISIMIDENRLNATQTTVWWAVYANDTDPVPTVAEVKAGTNAVTGAFNGSTGTPRETSTNGEYTIEGTISPALIVGTEYDVYIVVGDGTTDSRLDREDATAADDLAPTFGTVTAAPKAGESGSTQVISIEIPNLSVTSTIFWQILPTSIPVPTAERVVAASNNPSTNVTNGSAAGSVPMVTTIIAANGIETPPITLAEGTTYHVYVVAQDSAGRNSARSAAANLVILGPYICENGTNISGLTTDNEVGCQMCNDKYNPVGILGQAGTDCVANTYTCINGTPDGGQPSVNNIPLCESCIESFRLSSDKRQCETIFTGAFTEVDEISSTVSPDNARRIKSQRPGRHRRYALYGGERHSCPVQRGYYQRRSDTGGRHSCWVWCHGRRTQRPGRHRRYALYGGGYH